VPARLFSPAARLLAPFVVLAALAAGQFAAAAAAAIACLQPSSPLLAAGGAAAATAAVVIWRDQRFGWFADVRPLMAAVLLLSGLVMVWMAWANRKRQAGMLTHVLTGVLGFCTLAPWAFLVFTGFHLVRLHQWVQDAPAAVFSLALAGALVFSSNSALRFSAAPAAIAGIVAILAASTAFLDAFGRDPLLLPGPPGERTGVVWRRRLPGMVSSTLSLGADGTEWSVFGWGPDRSIVRAAGHVGSDAVTEERWTVPRSYRGRAALEAASAEGALLFNRHSEAGLLSSDVLRAWASALSLKPSTLTDVSLVSPQGAA
jgi:hypothetical protein